MNLSIHPEDARRFVGFRFVWFDPALMDALDRVQSLNESELVDHHSDFSWKIQKPECVLRCHDEIVAESRVTLCTNFDCGVVVNRYRLEYTIVVLA